MSLKPETQRDVVINAFVEAGDDHERMHHDSTPATNSMLPVDTIASSLEDIQEEFYSRVAWVRYRELLNGMLPPTDSTLTMQLDSVASRFHARYGCYDDLFCVRPEPGRGYGLFCKKTTEFDGAGVVLGFYTGSLIRCNEYMEYPDYLRAKWDDYAVTVYPKRYNGENDTVPQKDRVIVVGACNWMFANDASDSADPVQRDIDLATKPAELTFTWYEHTGAGLNDVLFAAIATTSNVLRKGFVHIDYGIGYWMAKSRNRMPLEASPPTQHSAAAEAAPGGTGTPSSSPANAGAALVAT